MKTKKVLTSSDRSVLSDAPAPKDEAWNRKINRAMAAREAAKEMRKGKPVAMPSQRDMLR